MVGTVLLADYWLHNLDPVVIQFTDRIAIRWYGLAYVGGFLAGFFLLRYLVRQGCSELRESQVGDFITYAAIFGVMVGGRLGYMLFYNLEGFLQKPWTIFYLLDGGMASHGGILGLVVFTWWYARRHRISWPGLGDNLVTVAPIGLLLGRLANFINGELYGRTSEVAWAIKFPQAVRELPDHEQNAILVQTGTANVEQLASVARDNPEVANLLREVLEPRHPSQLYEAALEGLVLFVILLVVRLRWKQLYHGILTGLFFILYAIFRISVEAVRQPDHMAQPPGMTRGQFYSLFMIAIGVAFLVWGMRTKRTQAERKPEADSAKTQTDP